MAVTAISTNPGPPASHDVDERARDYGRIERALQWLAENAERQPSLEESADAAGLSPFHFQRVFSRWAGVSPKQFLQSLSLEKAKQRLANGASVLEAAIDAGLSGPGRLHDAFVSVEAVTPGEYKRGLAGTRVAYGYHATPFGDCVAMVTARGLCGLGFVVGDDRDAAFQDLARRFPDATYVERSDETASTVQRVFAAASGARDAPLRVLLHGTPFQVQVWRALLEIPAGSHASYGDLAARIGSPGAARAVGAAVGANPIACLIPCHRVIRKTGALGGYHWGEGRKLAMLGMEALAARG